MFTPESPHRPWNPGLRASGAAGSSRARQNRASSPIPSSHTPSGGVGIWFPRSPGGGRLPAGAQRRWEEGTWFPPLPLLEAQPQFPRAFARTSFKHVNASREAARTRRVGRQWSQSCPFNKSLAGPKAPRIGRSGPWCPVMNLTGFPLFGPSGYWAEVLGRGTWSQ
jgi:hypothetical protein